MRLTRLLHDERGIALVAAVGIMVVLSMTTVSVMAFTTSSERHAQRATSDQVALALAEAGVNSAAAQLAEADDPLSSTLFTPSPGVTCPGGAGACFDDEYDTGFARWYGTFNLSGPNGFPTWTITSWGVVPSTTGGQDVVRRVVAEVDVRTTSVNEPNAASWNFVYSTRVSDATTCDVDITGTEVVVDVPLYVAGNLCITGTNAKIVEDTASGGQPVSVTVVGKLIFVGSNSKVGESAADPITRGAVGTGCGTSITGPVHACSPSTDRWWVETTGSADPMSAPEADFDQWYADAKPGPNHHCTTGSGLTEAQFDPDTTRDNDAGTFNLTPTSTSYTCQFWETNPQTGASELKGELSWNKTTKVLTVSGAIYIDGSVDFGYNGDVEYNGSATLYISGTFTLSGTNSRLCANATCDFASWNPNSEMLMIVANGSPTAIEFMGSNNKFMGALWTNSTASVKFTGTNVEMEGPMVAGSYAWGTRVKLKPLPVITDLPPGAPLTPNVHVEPDPPRYVGS